MATANFGTDFVSQQRLIVDRNTVWNLELNSSGNFLQVRNRQENALLHLPKIRKSLLGKKKKKRNAWMGRGIKLKHVAADAFIAPKQA